MDFGWKIFVILFFMHFAMKNDSEQEQECKSFSLSILPKFNVKSKGQIPIKPFKYTGKLFALAILLSNDVNPHPGPSIYPCGFCEKPVTWENPRALCCDDCDVWYHSACFECTNTDISKLQNTSLTWICCKCETPNVDSFSFHSYDLESYNIFSVLNDSCFSIPSSLDSTFSPIKHSSPKSKHFNSSKIRAEQHFSNSKESTSTNSDDAFLPNKNQKNKLRIITMNCQSIRNKLPSLKECLQYTKPDIILGCESWLDPTFSNSEVFPEGYNKQVIRKDRNKFGGGVFIVAKDELKLTEIKTDTSCEIVWGEIKSNQGSVLLGSFYRPPGTDSNVLDSLNDSINYILNKSKDKMIVLSGDFNLAHNNWNTYEFLTGNPNKEHHEKLLDICIDHSLEQMQLKPTRGGNILDLVLTNRPSLVNTVSLLPGIADHDTICTDTLIKPNYSNQIRRPIYSYHKANWIDIKASMKETCANIIKSKKDVEGKWNDLRLAIEAIMESKIPNKMASKMRQLPWLSKSDKKKISKKHRLFQKAKTSGTDEDKEKYRKHKRATQKATRASHWKHINTILDESLKEGNSKPFWKYIKSKRVDNIGVSGLKENGILYEDSKSKAEILLKQFTSVFTKEDTSAPLPDIKDKSFPSINNILVDEKGVLKLIKGMNVNKAAGPDGIPNKLLKACAEEVAPVLTNIFQESLNSSKLPADWKKANVTPLFKKGDKHVPQNYRPVSLTSVCCKFLEHIVCKHILSHLEKYKILSDLQHGFRSGHSCESQLIITINDLLEAYNDKDQIDLVILDFSKAFDTVPHQKLLHKLKNYGIDGKLNGWIEQFLTNRQQRVLVEGEFSSFDKVLSGVPQGTVLGPLLFLCHINDLPSHVKSQIRLFADDCLLYRKIKSEKDQQAIQDDLAALETWATTWGMKFNASKCYVMNIHRKQNPFTKFYQLSGLILQQVTENPYLGLIIRDDLQWSSHINKICSKASQSLGFIRRNLKHCNESFKQTAYISLVRSVLEYSCSVWDPHNDKEIKQLEKVQRNAARFVKRDYSRHSSVTTMMNDLNWKPLKSRRRECRLVLLYKIINNLVAIPPDKHFSFKQSKYNLRSNHSKQIITKSVDVDSYKFSFFPRTINQWNELSEQEVNCKSVSQLKAVLQKKI